MLEYLEKYFIKRYYKRHFNDPTNLHKSRYFSGSNIGKEQEKTFVRILNTLRENKVMCSKRKDGVYIRFAGRVKNGYYFSDKFVKVFDFNNKEEI